MARLIQDTETHAVLQRFFNSKPTARVSYDTKTLKMRFYAQIAMEH